MARHSKRRPHGSCEPARDQYDIPLLTLIDVLQQEFEDSCHFLLTATGILNSWKWPDIPGREDFKGKMVHSARWDPTLNQESMIGLDIALIGAGSTGIQILPQIQPVAKRVDHYMSSKTWISPIGFGSEELEARGVTGNCRCLGPPF